MIDPQRVEKWRGWMDAINHDVGHLLLRRTLFLRLHAMRAENPELLKNGDPFFLFLGELFVDSVVVGIRRQLKRKDANSLMHLLHDLAVPPGLPKRDGSHLDVAIPTGDIAELKRIARVCEDYADSRIAHLDSREPTLPTEQEVYDSLDALKGLVEKYFFLLHGGSIDVEPHYFLRFNEAFTFTWLPKLAPHTP